MTAPTPHACDDCLRRPWLLQAYAGHIERLISGAAGRRAHELLALDDEELAAAVAPNDGGRILARVAATPVAAMRKSAESAGCWAVCAHHEAYPDALRPLPDAPRALIGLGDAAVLGALGTERAVTVVGARRATAYGRTVAAELSRQLTRAGLTVVSGMALGIDAAAHRGALEEGATVAVLGCGSDVAYPSSNRGLHRRIAERGAVLSELPPGTTPWRWTFPARNRIMAGLAGMTVVVEGRVGSGSLITADLAGQIHRDLGAVPGPVNSRASDGPNHLLARGACVVRGAQDVLDAMLGPGATVAARPGPALDPELARALDALSGGRATPETLAAELGTGVGAAAVALARLELLGYAEGSALGAFTPTTLEPPS
jgi:DNA processing protein